MNPCQTALKSAGTHLTRAGGHAVAGGLDLAVGLAHAANAAFVAFSGLAQRLIEAHARRRAR